MQNMTSSCCIPLTRAPKATPLFLDYLYHYNRVEQFYGGPPQELASFKNVSTAIASRYPHRIELTEILEQQNRRFGCGEATLENIRRLRSNATFAVVTGQQVGLFSGPAFTLYKALSAIRLARSLTGQGLECVPVFWLATEDHDLEEIATTAVLAESGEMVSVTVHGDRAAPGSPVGYARLTGDVEAGLDQIEQALPEGEARTQVMRDLRECYAAGATWGEAFGRFITRLFGRFGVILIDPLHEPLRPIAQPVFLEALREPGHLRSLLERRAAELTAAGYHAQVHVGEDSTLLFATSEGARTPLAHREDAFYTNDSPRATLAEIEARLRTAPLEFTPSALLRPIVQDTLLPTVAYIPGPAELAYFAQAQAIYPEFGRPVPVLFPRASFTLAGRHEQRLMEKYHLSLDDVWQGAEHLRRRIAAAGAEGEGTTIWSERMERGEEDLKRFLDGLTGDAERVDPTLPDAVRNAKDKMLYQLDRLRGKISRAALERSELLTRHERALTAHLMPEGKLQERVVSGVNYLGQCGYELLDRLLVQIKPHCLDHQYFVY
ncbi:MAG TPA: bacillithiol biosynthesis cysteine-adding enzyme BshC [Terriglobia bacterium]|nr:bacillithiol biosynthesis cysteine-adding enzyme BshC [Terriglobia bacterium]